MKSIIKFIKRTFIFFVVIGLIGSFFTNNKASSVSEQIPITEKDPTKQPIGAKPPFSLTEADVVWDGDTSPHKDLFMAGMQKIYADNERCQHIEPMAMKSASKSAEEIPVFFVVCHDKDGKPFNVFFSKEDVESVNSLEEQHKPSKDMDVSASDLRREKIKSQFNPDGSHKTLQYIVKENMHDPDSYIHESTVYSDEGDYIIVRSKYRGRNAYGAMVRGSMALKFSIDGEFLDIVE